jgi:hypothetical protein
MTIMRKHLIAILFVGAPLLSAAGVYVTQCQGAPPQVAWRDSSRGACNLDNGHVFLVTADSEVGSRSWLVCLNRQSNCGWLYAPPMLLGLECQVPSPDIGINCKSHALPDQSYYVLQGQVRGHEMDGNLVLHPGELTGKIREFALQGRELDRKSVAVDDLSDARYSNVRYVEETGDLVGSELFIFHTGGHPSGIIIFYEGYWDEPVYASLPLLNLHAIASRKIEFELKLPEKIGKYRLTRENNFLILCRTDVPSVPDAQPIKLVRQSNLLPAASGLIR